MIADCQYALQGLSLWCLSSSIPTTQCCTQNAECKVMIMATQWPPYTALIYVLISSILHWALNSGAKGLMDVFTVL